MSPIDPQILTILGAAVSGLVTAIVFLFRQLLSAQEAQIKDRDRQIAALEATVARLDGMLRRATMGYERVVAKRSQGEGVDVRE